MRNKLSVLLIAAAVLAGCGTSGSDGPNPTATPLIGYSNGVAAITAPETVDGPLSPTRGQAFIQTFGDPASSTFFLAYDVAGEALMDGHLNFINPAAPAVGTYTEADFATTSSLVFTDRILAADDPANPNVVKRWTKTAGATLTLVITSETNHVLHGSLNATSATGVAFAATF